MMSYGVLKKIWDDHQTILDTQCEERRVRMPSFTLSKNTI